MVRSLCLAMVLSLGLPSLLAAATSTVAVIVVDFPASAPAPADTIAWVTATMAQVEDYYAEQSYGQFTLTSTVYGIYTVPLTVTATRSDIATTAKQAVTAAGYSLSGVTHFLYISPTTNTVLAGYGDLTGAWIALSPSSPVAPGVQMAAHELGHHIFNAQHAHGWICTDGTPLGTNGGTCGPWEYGNTLDAMGQGYGHFNALAKQSLGWLTPGGPQRIQTITTSGDHTIAPYETSTPGVKALFIQTRSGFGFALEYRQPIGFDAYLPGTVSANVYNGVSVHLALNGSELLKMTPSNNDAIDTPALTVGQTFCDKVGKWSMLVLSATTSGVQVRVKINGKCL